MQNTPAEIEKEDLSAYDSPEFREMKMRAEAAEAKLRRIYNTPIWRASKPIRKIYAKLNIFIEKISEKKFEFELNPAEGTPVVELITGKIRFEAENANLKASAIAIVAHYSKSPKISESLKKYLRELINNFFEIILVSACESEMDIALDEDLKSKITIIRKPNLGYDFGSWATALSELPEIFNCDELLLTNDSLIGPFDDISQLLDSLRSSNFDITGLTDSNQLQYHIQSYMIHLKKSAVTNTNIQKMLNSVVHLALKNDVILKYELGLTRTAQLSGLFVGAVFPWNLVVGPEKNPSLVGWERMLELGFPFLKREAVRLASSTEKKKMLNVISAKYPASNFAISEINSVP